MLHATDPTQSNAKRQQSSLLFIYACGVQSDCRLKYGCLKWHYKHRYLRNPKLCLPRFFLSPVSSWLYWASSPVVDMSARPYVEVDTLWRSAKS